VSNQKKQSKRLAGATRVVGVDSHPDIFSATWLTGATNDEATVVKRSVDVAIGDLESWASQQLQAGDVVVLEAGSNSFEFVSRLAMLGFSAHVLESYQVSKTAEAFVDNDVIASERIARSYLTGMGKKVWIPDQITRERRELLHTYNQVVEAETRAINQLRGYLNQYHIRLEKRNPRQEVSQKWILEQRPWSPMQRVILEQLFKDLSHASLQTNELYQLVCQEVACNPIMLGCLRLLGIGPVNAFAIVATVGDIQRFATPGKLVAYLGLNPGLKKSGNGKRVKVGIGGRGRGRRDMRCLLIQGAQAVFRQKAPNALRDWAWKIFLKKGNRNVAVAAIARRMAIQLWHLLRGRGVNREDQQKSLATKLRHITTTIGKKHRTQVGLPSNVIQCVAELMKRIEQTNLPAKA
jgi:transposase